MRITAAVTDARGPQLVLSEIEFDGPRDDDVPVDAIDQTAADAQPGRPIKPVLRMAS